LWLLVLVNFVTPPIISIPVLPLNGTDLPQISDQLGNSEIRTNSDDNIHGEENLAVARLDITPIVIENGKETDATGNKETAIDVESTEDAASSPRVAPLRARRGFSLREACVGLLGVSLFVSMVVCSAALRQLRRVRRLLRGTVPESDRTADLVQEVSRQFGLRSAPNLLIVDASITPMLWVEPGNSAIVLPRQLADSLDDDQLRNIVSHEIAHYVRRDHWANLFAFLVTSLFWWNPISWFARRATTNAAEASCDALALERMASSRRSYAATLLAVVDFVTSKKTLRPTLTVTFGESRSIKRRFELIANSDVKANVSRVGWLLLAFGSASLLLIPARAQEEPQSSSTPSPAPPPGPVDRAFALPQHEVPTRPALSTGQPGAQAVPVPLTVPNNPLRGVWTAQVNAAGPDHDQTQKMFAFFGGNFGLLSDHEGKATLLFGFRFFLGKPDGQMKVELTFPGDHGKRETLYGICEVSKNEAYLCFCGDQYHTINGWPKSFKEANPRAYSKVVLTRDGTSSKSSKPPPDKAEPQPVRTDSKKSNANQSSSTDRQPSPNAADPLAAKFAVAATPRKTQVRSKETTEHARKVAFCRNRKLVAVLASGGNTSDIDIFSFATGELLKRAPIPGKVTKIWFEKDRDRLFVIVDGREMAYEVKYLINRLPKQDADLPRAATDEVGKASDRAVIRTVTTANDNGNTRMTPGKVDREVIDQTLSWGRLHPLAAAGSVLRLPPRIRRLWEGWRVGAMLVNDGGSDEAIAAGESIVVQYFLQNIADEPQTIRVRRLDGTSPILAKGGRINLNIMMHRSEVVEFTAQPGEAVSPDGFAVRLDTTGFPDGEYSIYASNAFSVPNESGKGGSYPWRTGSVTLTLGAGGDFDTDPTTDDEGVVWGGATAGLLVGMRLAEGQRQWPVGSMLAGELYVKNTTAAPISFEWDQPAPVEQNQVVYDTNGDQQLISNFSRFIGERRSNRKSFTVQPGEQIRLDTALLQSRAEFVDSAVVAHLMAESGEFTWQVSVTLRQEGFAATKIIAGSGPVPFEIVKKEDAFAGSDEVGVDRAKSDPVAKRAAKITEEEYRDLGVTTGRWLRHFPRSGRIMSYSIGFAR
jgi:beta-lactamase regulating signal transducer with metallopeptidase domain